MALIAVSYLLFGLVIGSFLNVVIYRIGTAESFISGYSKCPACKKRIRWFDLIPLLSFLLLRGKCRHCQTTISWQYPLIEALTGLFFLASFFLYGPTFLSALSAVVLSLFLAIVVFDLKEMIVPDSIAWLLLGITLVGKLILDYNHASTIILGGVVAGGVIALLVYGSRGKWMGDGDIKIAVTLGLFLTFPVAIFGMFAAFISGAIVGSVMLISKRKKTKDQLPFTPFLLAGLLLAMFWGQQIVDWYLGRFII